MVPSEAHSLILGVVLDLTLAPESLPYNRISLSNLSNQPTLELCLGFEAHIWFFRDWDRPQEEEKLMCFFFFLSSTQHWFYTSSSTSPTAHLIASHKGDEIGVINCVRDEEGDTTPARKPDVLTTCPLFHLCHTTAFVLCGYGDIEVMDAVLQKELLF